MQKSNLLKRSLFLILLSIIMVNTQAQTGLNFQGVARTTSNLVVASQPITIKLSILQGSATGTAEYTETRRVITNAQGLFTAVIGDTGAISTLGSFASINWKLSPKFLKIEMDPAAGTNFVTMGTTQFQYVPYAQYAKIVDAENINGIVPVTLGGTGVNSLSSLKTALAIDKINNTADLAKPISTAAQTALDLKSNASDVTTSLALKENISNKSTTTILGTSDDLYPTQKAVKTYVDAQVASSAISIGAIGSSNAKGAIIASNVLSLTPADGTNGGIITTGTQTIAGAKTFSSDLNINGLSFGRGGGGINSNTASGISALVSNTTGSYNIAIGADALNKNTTGSYNSATGPLALNKNTTGTQNTANGYTSLYSNTTGSNNTAIGADALFNNTTGSYNIAIGPRALFRNTIGTQNTANGYSSLYSNTEGNANTANGYYSLYSNTIGYGNTANGFYSLQSNTTGNYLTANGSNSLRSNTTGGSNTANGSSALYYNTTGSSNTANGSYALYSNTTGGSNTANGSSALYSNTTGSSNAANGSSALYSNTTGNFNTASGAVSLFNNTTGSYNTANGNQSLYSNTTGGSNTANGYYSLLNNISGSYNTGNGYGTLRSNTTGENNTANGSSALYSNTTGSYNTANGSPSLNSNTTGENNTAIGSFSLSSNTQGSNNTAIGSSALNSNTIGSNNTATGYNALYSNTTAVSNNAYGNNALYLNTSGYSNNAFGFQSLYRNTIGSANTGYGQSSLYLNSTGSNNTAIGYGTLDNNSTGSNNTGIGYEADVSSNNLSNATAIGSGAIVTASNTIQLGNTSVTNVKTSGTITAGALGLGVSSPDASALLEVSSTTKGFLPPRMTYAQRNLISNPANGLIIFCLDCGLYGEPQFYDGNNDWRKLDISLGSGTGSLNLVVNNLNQPTNGTGGQTVGQSFTTTSNPGRLIKIVTSAIGGVTGTQLTNGIANSYLRIRRYVNDNEIISPNALSGEILATSNTKPTILNYDYAAYFPTVEFTFPNSIVLLANTKYVIEFVAGSGVYNYVKIAGTYSGGQAYDLSGTNISFVRDFPFQLYLQQF